MRGTDLKIPRLPRSMLSATDYTFWEALYEDGTVLREDTGARYAQIDRARLRSFRLVRGGETLVEAFPPDGATGWNLCYRRRTIASEAARHPIILVGWVPMGPALALDADADDCRVSERGFVLGDLVFDPPTPRPDEGEHFSFAHLLDDPVSRAG